jgi:flagellar basal body-associated protein FliL
MESTIIQEQPHPQKNNTLLIIIAVFVVFLFTIVAGIVFWKQQNNHLMETEKIKNENPILIAKIKDMENSVSKAISEKENIEKATCSGTWRNGVCIRTTCIDSDVNDKPNDIYIKGTVTYTDTNDKATTVSDFCSGVGNQINEMWCYESPKGSGNYVQGNMGYTCTKGCFDGACKK